MISKIINGKAGPPRQWRRSAITASLAIVGLTLAGCSSGSGNNNSNSGNNTSSNSSSNSSGSSNKSGKSGSKTSSTTSAACGTKSLDPYAGIEAAEAPSVTASNVDLPKGTPGDGKPKITLGAKNFDESTTVGELYKQALQAKGYRVTFKKQIGPSETIDKAFKAGEIDLYPEYLGEITTSLAGDKQPETALENYKDAKKFEQNKRNATIFKQTPYQDVDILLVTPQFCQKNHLKSAASLKNVGHNGSKVVYTAQAAARTRYAGFKGLKQAYGLTNAKFKGAPTGGSTLKVVKQGDANVADGFSTTQSIVDAVNAGKFVALKDPKHIMGFQYVAPVVKQSVAKKEGPAFKQTLNWVDSKLTLKVIHSLNKAIQDNNVPVAKASKKFLQANGLK